MTRRRVLKILIEQELFDAARQKAKDLNFSSFSEYVRTMLRQDVFCVPPTKKRGKPDVE